MDMLKNIDSNPQKQKLIVYIILTLATLAVYWQVTQYGFVNLDDDDYVRQNRLIRLGIEGIPLGIQHNLCPILASSDVAFPDG